jgi:pre-mRNA-processing factor 40
LHQHGKSDKILIKQRASQNPSLTTCIFKNRDSFLSSLAAEEKEDSRFKVSSQLTDSDRQLLFADFVIELQAAEDDKRRRIRDARRRAEKAQREAYRVLLKRMAVEGTIRPYTAWRIIEEFVTVDESFIPVLAQDRDAPREIFEEFIDTWDDIYRRERAFLSRFINPPDKKEIKIDREISFENFSKVLLVEAEYSAELYGDTRRIINKEEPVSSARLYWEELVSRASHSNGRQGAHRTSLQEDSSEDEGEIIEDGEVGGDGGPTELTEISEESNPLQIEGEKAEAQDNSGEETKENSTIQDTTSEELNGRKTD